MVSVLGRTAELATIESFLADGQGRSGRLVLHGPSGIGKTVLWEQAVGGVRAGADRTVLETRASEAEADLPLVSLTDLLGRIPDEIIAGLADPQRDALDAALLRRRVPVAIEPRTLGMAVMSALGRLADERPLLIAIDDAQWVDVASAAALAFALRRLAGRPVAVLATARAVGDGSSPAFIRTLTRPPDGAMLEIGPVSLGVLHHLVLDRLGTALTRHQLARLEAETGGNPLLAIELAGALGRLQRWPLPGEPLPLPPDTGTLLRDRIGREPRAVRDLLLIAAGLSSPTAVAIAAVGPLKPAAIGRAVDAAVASRLLTIDPDGRLRFPHPMIASAAQAIAPAEVRRRLHARLAEQAATIEERGRHIALAVSERSDRMSAALDAAAVAARSRGATEMAADWMERAAALTPADDRDAWAGRVTRAAYWRAGSGEIERARALIEDAIPFMPAGDRRAAALHVLAQMVGWDEGAVAVVAACRRALEEAVAPDVRARLRLRIATEAEIVGTAGALAEIEAALTELEGGIGLPDPDLVACAMLQRASLRLAGGLGIDHILVSAAIELLDEAPRRGPDGDEWAESLRAHALVWQWWSDLDEHERARDRQTSDFRRDLERGHDRPTPIEAADLAFTELCLGDLEAADRYAVEAKALAEQTGGSAQNRSVALGARAAIDAVRGELDAAERAARAGLALVNDDWLAGRHLAALGLIALSDGRPEVANAVLGGLFDRLLISGQVETVCTRMVGDLLEAAAASGDTPRIRGVVAELEARDRTVPRPWIAANLARGRAFLASADGDLEAAAGWASEAIVHAEQLRMPFELGRVNLLAGRLDRRRKARRSAASHLERARALFAGVGAARWVAIADGERSRTGRRTVGSDSLSETEDAVARLAARGLTNHQVGDAAFLTAKSVEGVLARVYAKLGIRSRAELGAWLRDQTGDGPSSDRESPV